MQEWVQRKHSKGQIDRSGKNLLPWWTTPDAKFNDDDWEAYKVVQNWRTSHSLPLNVIQAGLRVRARKIESSVIVAQRLKRFSSVMNKLVREPSMKLSQMQDLGGCRAILSDVKTVRELFATYQNDGLPFPGEGSIECYDYLNRPKADGYRGIHVVARYHPRIWERTAWDGNRIEIQIRTKLQHAFATAVETVTTFTRQPLKFGAGTEEWKRFFCLIGCALAVREGTQPVPGAPSTEKEVIDELREAAKSLRVHQRLAGWTGTLRTLRATHIKNSTWLLLRLDTTQNTVSVTGYGDDAEASRAVSTIDQEKRTDIDAVLVWVNSIRRLRAAYPNYYADTTAFLDALKIALR